MKSSNIKNLNNVKKIYFIGIGGSGMFPLAGILHKEGFEVSGSDIYESDTLEKVRNLGITVNLKQEGKNISNQDLVVFSAAIKENNPEIVAAKNKNIPIIERSVMLGIIFNQYKNSIGVSGTHGKTTTTSMITSALLDSNQDITSIIGGTLPKINSNSCLGKSDIIVTEACEYVDSFLQLNPKISVITNIEADHLDYFGSLENIKKSFRQFALQTSNLIVANGDDANVTDTLKNINHAKIVFFGKSEKNDYYPKNVIFNTSQCANFDIYNRKTKLAHISLSVPGVHNLYNALASFAVCDALKINHDIISKGLENFSGVHRRFEKLCEINGVTIVDDFAHHPTEIATTLTAALKMNFRKVWAIFQPHTFSRTYTLMEDFAKALSIPQVAIISDILPVRETNVYGISSKNLVEKIPGSLYIPTFEEITDYICQNVRQGDLVITLGGGNIYKCANMIAKKMSHKLSWY